MVTKKTIITYKGRNSPTTIAVSLFGSLVDFVDAETNKMGVVINGVEYSSTDGFVEFANGGEVTFKLGAVPNPPKKKLIGRLVMYTDDFPLGNPILTEKTDFQLVFEFV